MVGTYLIKFVVTANTLDIKLIINVGDDRMTEKFNAFRPGSLAHLIVEAEPIEDILYIIAPDEHYSPLKIICKPNYNINTVLNFVEDNLPVEIRYEIVVESEEIIE